MAGLMPPGGPEENPCPYLACAAAGASGVLGHGLPPPSVSVGHGLLLLSASWVTASSFHLCPWFLASSLCLHPWVTTSSLHLPPWVTASSLRLPPWVMDSSFRLCLWVTASSLCLCPWVMASFLCLLSQQWPSPSQGQPGSSLSSPCPVPWHICSFQGVDGAEGPMLCLIQATWPVVPS